MAVGVGDAVRVTARIAPAGVLRRDFGRTLYLHREATVPTARSAALRLRDVRTYPTAASLAVDSPPAAVETAAGVYFQQSPFPRNLMLASVIGAVQPSLIFGAGDRNITAIAALGDDVALPIGAHTVMADFDSLTTLADAATAIQTGLNASANLTGATVTVVDGGFVVNVPSTVDIGDGFASSAATEILGLTGAGFALARRVEVIETVAVALTRIEGRDCSFYWVVVDPSIAGDVDDATTVANWVAARPFQLMLDVFGSNTLVTGETTSIGAVISALGQAGVSAIYNGIAIDHKALSYAARFSSVNFAAPNALISGKFKTLPGTTPTVLSSSERAELDRKRINWYAFPPSQRTGVADTAEGKTFATWIDVQYWLDWLGDALEVETYQRLRASNKIPQTTEGVAVILDAVVGVFEQGVRNGGIAPGLVSSAIRADIASATGNREFGGFLGSGYLVHAGSVAEQGQTDRDARKSPPFRGWAKGSGAINSVDIDVVFEN